MTRTTFFSAIAAFSLISVGASITSVNAAELSGSHRNYNAKRDYNYSYDKPAPRPAVRDDIDRDYDEGDTSYERRRRHGDGWGRHHSVRRVEARASYASDYLPYYVREWRAKRSAIEAWKFKVANTYGERFSHWRMATEKQVNCDTGAASVYCSVSARPAPGGSRWSWNREHDLR